VDRHAGLRFDQTVVLCGFCAQQACAQVLRPIGYRDPQTGKALAFLTHHFNVSVQPIVRVYHGRWRIELFFK